MYDSTTITDMPSDGDLVGYYCDGIYAVTRAVVQAQFTNAILVPISAIGTDDGIVGDCERGDMTKAQLVDWVLARRAAGFDPTGYVNELNGWGLARAEFATRGVPEPHWWVSNYDGDPTIPPGAIAKQFRGSFRTPPIGTGAHYDQSSVADLWPGVDGVYGPGGGIIGGNDMTPEERAWVRVAARGFLPPRPASLGDENSAGHSDGDFLGIFATASTADFIAAYGQDGYSYISALYHGNPVKPSGSASKSVSGSFTGTIS